MRRICVGSFVNRAMSLSLCIACAVLMPFSPSVAQKQVGEDTLPPADMLLLYDSTGTNATAGFEKAVTFYGLTLARVDISSTPVTDALLKSAGDAYYAAIFVDGGQVDSIDQDGIQALRSAVNEGGADLLISNFRVDNSAAISALTDGEITGSTLFSATSKNYLVTTNVPDVTGPLSGVSVRHATPPKDRQLSIAPSAQNTQILAYEIDDNGQQSPLFARFKTGNGDGEIFIVSDNTEDYLRTNLLAENYYVRRADGGYYTQQWFSQITPLLMSVRRAGADRAWHAPHHYANFTVDDPKLQQSAFDYAGMLEQAKTHHFHFTLAAVPATIRQRDQSVVDIFAKNSDYMSIVQHGNNHDGYEFYKYETTAEDPYPARPFDKQVTSIAAGRQSMLNFAKQTSVPYGQIMVFPYNIAPSPTLTVLKENNFQATINSSDIPLDTPRARRWDVGMYPADLAYNDFAVMLRYGTGQSPFPFLFFLGKPVAEYDHIDRFQNGIDGYNDYADAINSVYGGNVEWKSLDYILKHMYLEKVNQDESRSVMYWGNNIIITNEANTERVYHTQREETLNVPIVSVTVNGIYVHYKIADDRLQVDMTISPGKSHELLVTYGDGSIPSMTYTSTVFLPPLTR